MGSVKGDAKISGEPVGRESSQVVFGASLGLRALLICSTQSFLGIPCPPGKLRRTPLFDMHGSGDSGGSEKKEADVQGKNGAWLLLLPRKQCQGGPSKGPVATWSHSS